MLTFTCHLLLNSYRYQKNFFVCVSNQQSPDQVITWIKDSLYTDTPLRMMYLKNKSDIFTLWCEALQSKIEEGSLDIPINKVANHIRRELIEMDLESAIHRMYEVIPQKFKHAMDDIEIAADDLLEAEKSEARTESSSTEIDYATPNQTLINNARNILESATELIRYLQTHEVNYDRNPQFTSTVTSLGEAIKEKAKFLNDGRQKVCKLDQVHLLQILQESTLNASFDELTAQKMKNSTITSKQVRKFSELSIKEIDQVLAPTTDIQAKQLGFLGVHCEQCNKLRLKREYNPSASDYQDHCYDCDNWQPMGIKMITPTL